MKKLTSLLIIITTSIFLASCGSDNSTSSGSSFHNGATSKIYNNSCLQDVANYINTYKYSAKDYKGNQISYESVKINFQIKEVEMNTTEKCIWGDSLCGNYTNNDVIYEENGDKVVHRAEQNSKLFSILNSSDRCLKKDHIYEIIQGDTLYHINVSIPQEANPVRVIERYDTGSYDDYYVSRWQIVI